MTFLNGMYFLLGAYMMIFVTLISADDSVGQGQRFLFALLAFVMLLIPAVLGYLIGRGH